MKLLAVTILLASPLAIHLAVTDRLLLRWLCVGVVVAVLLAALVVYSAVVVGARSDEHRR